MSIHLTLQVPHWDSESVPPTLRNGRTYKLPYASAKRGGDEDVLAKAITGPADLESLDLGPGLELGPDHPVPEAPPPDEEEEPSATSQKKHKRPGKSSKSTAPIVSKLVSYGNPTVWPYDRVSELKEKIYLHTGIPPFRQHLRQGDTPLSYEVMAEVAVQLPASWPDLPTVQDLPIREDLATNRESLRIYALDHFTSVSEIHGTQLTVWDLADFLRHPDALRGDHHQLALVYYGFLVLYWPLLSWEALLAWLRAPDHLGTAYPELSPPPATLLKRYAAEHLVLQRMSESGPASTQKALSDPTIRQAVATLRGNRAMLNISRLLAHTHTGAAAPLVRARLYYEHRSALITKVHEQRGEAAFEHMRYRLQMPEMPSLVIAVSLRAREHDYAALVLRSHGPIQVRTQWNESDRMSFAQLTRLLTHTNPYIQHINALGREVLTSSHALPILTPENIRYTSVTVQLFWPRTLAPEAWTRLLAHVQGDFPAGVAAPHPEENVPQGMYMFRFLKGTETRAEPPRTETELDSYEYLTNAKTRVRWIAAYGNGRTVVLLNRATDLRVEIQDTREAELPLLREYLTGHLRRAEAGGTRADRNSHSPHPARGTSWKVSPKNTLRLLKSMDPNLFNFRQHGSDVVYSRVCQKSHQPIALTQAQYKAAIADPTTRRRYQFVPYRNFTNPDQPLVYTCLHPNNPHFSLISGQHPKGYCLPCCKKTAMDLNEKTKRSHQYRMCLERGEYSGEPGDATSTSSSRYILNYGKALEINRIGHLPDLFLRYLLYNSQLLVGADLRNIGQSAYYLYGVPQTAAQVDSLGVLYCLSNALGVAPEEYLGGLAKALRGHPEWHANMVQGQLGDYYPMREFLQDLSGLTETGQHHALRFQLWNEVIIELTKYVHDLDVVILEDLSTDTSGTSHRASAEGVDLVLPRHVTRAEEIFPPMAGSKPTRAERVRAHVRRATRKRGGADGDGDENEDENGAKEDENGHKEEASVPPSQRRYIVVLRRQRRSKGLFGSHYSYFPIYRVTPQSFFRDNAIEQRVYTEHDDLIHLLRQLAVQALEGSRAGQDWALPDLLAQSTQLRYAHRELLLNHRGQVHTLVLDARRGSGRIYVPIPYQYPTEGLPVHTALPDRSQAVELAQLLAFLDAWNTVRETWRLQRTLCDRRDRVLGVKAGGLYFYCHPAPVHTVSKLLRGTALWPLEQSIQYMWHMPEEINRAVERPQGDLPDPGGLRAKAEEGMRSYRREVRQIMSQFDRDRNPAMRKRIAALGRRGRRSMVADLQDLGVSPTDIERLQTNGFQLGSDLYEFDQVRLARIHEMGDREEIRAYLGRQFPRVSGVTLDLLAADLSNPLQREYLLRAILLEDLSLDEVRHWPDEEVYILR